MRPRSLRAIVALYVALILAALLAERAATYSIAHDGLKREVDRRLETEAVEVGGEHAQVSIAAMAARIAGEEADHESADLFFMLLDPAGRQIAGGLRLNRVPPPGFSDFDEAAGVPGVAHGRLLSRRVGEGATLVVVSDNDVIEAFDALLSRVQLIGLGFAGLIAVAGAAGIVWEIANRLRTMQRTVDAVMAGNFASRIPIDGTRSEFDRQAAAFNRMLDRIQALMGNMKHAAKDVAHELKSPLARLHASLAATSRHAAGNVLAPEIESALQQTDEMLALFASLMRLWEIEGGHRRERFATVDLAALVAATGEALAAVAEDRAQWLTVQALGPCAVRGDAHLLRQLIVNLVENAIRHCPAGTRIALSAVAVGKTVRIVVSDTGPGIPAALHQAVIRRFGRLDSAADVPGQGLGLALVDAIARLHDGTMTFEDAAPGFRVVIDLPHAA